MPHIGLHHNQQRISNTITIVINASFSSSSSSSLSSQHSSLTSQFVVQLPLARQRSLTGFKLFIPRSHYSLEKTNRSEWGEEGTGARGRIRCEVREEG
eukprot:766817-Hanusia_phi.AAC.5